ncbi:MAG: hypothetical protein EON88_05975 [Brevundimonas sp.]|nr:MAG: hypothetical protein EON88_05975 [Brevundimonas sp.]
MPTGVVAWVKLLGGLIVWAIHFGGLYAIASWMDLSEASDAPGRWIAVGFSLACMVGAVGAAVVARRDPQLSSWSRSVALSGALIAGLAVMFQAVPFLVL